MRYYTWLDFCLTYVFLLRICIPVSDLLSGNIGEGVEEILAMSGGERIHVQNLGFQLIRI